MSQPTSSGPISAGRDIVAHTINTRQITQHTNLTLNVIVERLDQLAGILAQPDGSLRLSASENLEVVAGEQASLLLPANLLEALHLLPRAGDAPVGVRRRAYAAWLVTQRPTRPEQEVAAHQHYIPLTGWVSLEDLPLALQLTERRWVGTGPERRLERTPLADVTQAMQRHLAFVLLGPPGCGKSTVLRRLTLDMARAYLTGQDTRLPMRINLANYAGPQGASSGISQAAVDQRGPAGRLCQSRPSWRGGAAGRWPQRNGAPGHGERAPATGECVAAILRGLFS